MTSLARAMMSMLLILPVAGGVGDSDPPGAELPTVDTHPGQLPWDRIDTVAVLGSGPTWDEPPFYRVFDAVLDNEGDAVFLVNGGDGELIRYDIGSGRTSRIGRRGSGPGEFGRPVWLEPHGPDSLLAYDVSLGRFSVFSRSGDFGRIFTLPGMLASREGSLWIVEEADESTVFHVFGESGGGWVRQGRLGFGGTARILDVSGNRAVFLHFDELDRETVVVGRAAVRP